MYPFFKIQVGETDELGIDFNSFVDAPAHMKAMIHFNNKVHYQFNEEKRIVTGVMISANTPIYRNSRDFGRHYVIFDAKTIDIIRKKFFKNGFIQNLNANHDMKQLIKGAYLIDSYIVSTSDPRYPNVPEAFEDQKIIDGSWIGSYFIEDNALWQDVKAGKFNGFSVEGWFDKIEVKVKQKHKKMTKSKSIWERMGFTSDVPKVEFATATTADGTVVSWEGDLMEGTMCFVEVDGEQIPAPEGEHELTLEDGTVKIITLDGTGMVTAVSDLEPLNEELEELKSEVAEVMKKTLAEVNDRFVKLEKENADLKAEMEAILKGDKFASTPKKVGVEKKSYKDLLK